MPSVVTWCAVSAPGRYVAMASRTSDAPMLRSGAEAMLDGVKEDGHIQSRVKDVEAAVTAIRSELIERLPKMRRSGRVITKGLAVTVTDATVLAVA